MLRVDSCVFILDQKAKMFLGKRSDDAPIISGNGKWLLEKSTVTLHAGGNEIDDHHN